MKKLLLIPLIFVFLIVKSYSDDIRNISVGENINNIKERGYTGFKCYYNDEEIKNWYMYSNCPSDKNNYYLIKFEYDERFALNENFEGTQISGHPVIIYLSIDKNSIVQEINAFSDPSAPFYFRKQAYLLWLRVYGRYGSDNWMCEEKPMEKGHVKIGKEYINRTCNKVINNKKYRLDTHFYFKNNKQDKENLVSKSFLQIKFQPNN